MKLKHFLLAIVFLSFITISFTSCSEGDEMRQGATADNGTDLDSAVQSTKSFSTDTIAVPDFTKD